MLAYIPRQASSPAVVHRLPPLSGQDSEEFFASLLVDARAPGRRDDAGVAWEAAVGGQQSDF